MEKYEGNGALPWLTPDDRCPKTPVVMTAEFETAQNDADIELEITGLGLFRAYVDGESVGEDYLTPGCNDYDAYVRVLSYRVDRQIKHTEGRHTLTVWLGDGWYKGRYGIDKPEDKGGRVWGDRYLLAARLTAPDGKGGRRTLLSTGEPSRWRAEQTPLVETSIYDGEVWGFSRAVGESYPCVSATGRLPERQLPFFGAPVRLHSVKEPQWMTTPAGETVLDFGENLAGIVRVTGRIPKGQTLLVEHGELLVQGNFCRNNLRSARARLSITGDGRERVVEPLFTYYGFRYVRLSGLEGDALAGLRFEALVLSSAGEGTLRFSCDRPELTELVACARRGQLANFVDIPTDCPQRDERLGWGADAWIFAGSACYLSDCRAMYEKYLYDLRVEQTRYYAGDLPMYAPSLKGEAGAGGAGWADVGVLLPWLLYERYGDPEALTRHYPLMRDYAEQLLTREQGRGYIRGAFTFGDWLAGDGMTPGSRDGGTEHDYITNLFLWRVLMICRAAAVLVGQTPDADRYEAAAARVREAFFAEYYTPNGRLCVDTQTAHVLVLAFGLYRSREAVVAGLLRRLERDGWVMKTGFLGTPFLLPVLFDNGQDAAAYRILLRRDPPGWLYELSMGATTFWERWNSILPDGRLSDTGMNSLDHYAYGSVLEALVSRVAGLMPDAPGWARVRVCPHPGAGLRRLDMTFASPRGELAVSWRVDGEGCVTVSGRLPDGVPADVYLPDGQVHRNVTGAYDFRSAPLPHLVHPFGADTPLCDILSDPTASELFRRRLPQAYAILTEGEPDLLVKPLRFLSTLAFFGVGQRELDELIAELERQ